MIRAIKDFAHRAQHPQICSNIKLYKPNCARLLNLKTWKHWKWHRQNTMLVSAENKSFSNRKKKTISVNILCINHKTMATIKMIERKQQQQNLTIQIDFVCITHWLIRRCFLRWKKWRKGRSLQIIVCISFLFTIKQDKEHGECQW